MKVIHDSEFIKNQYSEFGGIYLIENNVDSFEVNLNALALDDIISSLHQNNIHVIIIVTPHDQTFNETVDEELLNTFNNVLNAISEKHNVKIYSFYDLYLNENIWTNFNHIAYNNNNSMIFSKDISKIILDEYE